MALYVLNSSVQIEGNVIKIDNTAVFECNEDALDLMRVMYEFTQRGKAFRIDDIMEYLEIDQTEDNIFAIQNAVHYLKGCFIISEC